MKDKMEIFYSDTHNYTPIIRYLRTENLNMKSKLEI